MGEIKLRVLDADIINYVKRYSFIFYADELMISPLFSFSLRLLKAASIKK